jgi:hypothetical protein
VVVYLNYRVDVWVEVDLVEGFVEGVTVDNATLAIPSDIVDASGRPVADHAEQEAARRIADEGEWLSWEFGDAPVASR